MMKKFIIFSLLIIFDSTLASEYEPCWPDSHDSKAIYLCQFANLPIELNPINDGEHRSIIGATICISKQDHKTIPYILKVVLNQKTLSENGSEFEDIIPMNFLVETDNKGSVKESLHKLGLRISPRCVSMLTESQMRFSLDTDSLTGAYSHKFYNSGWCSSKPYSELDVKITCKKLPAFISIQSHFEGLLNLKRRFYEKY